MERFKRVLSVAGSDSGGGAGIQADLKTIAACGCYGMTAITAVTVQNTQGVRGVHAVPADVVAGQIDAVLEDIGADAVKLGMLPSEAIIVETARLIRKYGVRHVVMDPVMIATSGDRLVAESAVEAILRHIFPLAALVTPNIPEAEYLTGLKIRSEDDFPRAAGRLVEKGARGVLLKAGHLQGAELTEYLYTSNSVTATSGSTRRTRTARAVRSPQPSRRFSRRGTSCRRPSVVRRTMCMGRSWPGASIGPGAGTVPFIIFTGSGNRLLSHKRYFCKNR